MEYQTFDTAEIDHRQVYRLLAGSVVPRPIAWVSSISKEGVLNLAPFSFFTCICHAPPLLSIAVGETQKRMKDTAKNILETGSYVIHTVVNGYEEIMNKSATDLPSGMSEFEFAEIETVPSDVAAAPRIKDAPIAMECKLHSIITNGKEWKTHCVIGEVMRWHVRKDLMIEGKYIDPVKLQPVGRLGGANYCRTQEIFQMERTWPPPDLVDPNAPQ